MMKTILLTDLDDTLFTSARKQPPNELYILATTLSDGTPSAYLSPKQQQFLKLWQENALCIPVTARNLETFNRVHISFKDFAIINHGGTILCADGTLDTIWHEQQRHHAAKSAIWLQNQYEQLKYIAKQQHSDINIRINHDCGLDLYILLKSKSGNEAAVEEIAKKWQEQHSNSTEGYLHYNGNNLAILPHWLGKANAVLYLQEKLRIKYGDILSIGFGDSNSDLPFMRCCDYWMTPSISQISK